MEIDEVTLKKNDVKRIAYVNGQKVFEGWNLTFDTVKNTLEEVESVEVEKEWLEQ